MCELSCWNGRVYIISRNDIEKFEKRNDSRTGLYYLFGKDDSNSITVYIGKAEKIITRLKQHLSDKNYWNDAIAVISKDNLLNKAHVKYLENEFYKLANESSRAYIINRSIPTRSTISEYDEAMLKKIIGNTKLLVNTLGYKAFKPIEPISIGTPLFFIKATRGANGIGKITPDGFIVSKGSVIASSVTNSYSTGSDKRRKFLIDKSVVSNTYEVLKDSIFNSPSSAAEFVLGRSANGLTEWKTEECKTLKSMLEKL